MQIDLCKNVWNINILVCYLEIESKVIDVDAIADKGSKKGAGKILQRAQKIWSNSISLGSYVVEKPK